MCSPSGLSVNRQGCVTKWFTANYSPHVKYRTSINQAENHRAV